MRKHKIALAFVVWLSALATVQADDAAASIAEGGIVMVSEPRITMAKEVLQISTSKVIVDYDFRNDSNQDIVTFVAFPIPSYTLDISKVDQHNQGFDDFRLWVDGQPTAFHTESRAYMNGEDKTALLNSMGVDVASFGHMKSDASVPDFERLEECQRQTLWRAGLLGAGWEVHKKYYWEQKFPARGTVHIRHTYSPAVGYLNSIDYEWEKLEEAKDDESVTELSTFCIRDRLRQVLGDVVAKKRRNVSYAYVDFILTTANTWKTPIQDFTLIVDRSVEERALANYASFCWVGPVTEEGPDHFIAKATNFVPKNELRIGFFRVEKAIKP